MRTPYTNPLFMFFRIQMNFRHSFSLSPIFVLLLLLIQTSVYSQDRKISKAESYFEMHRYHDASNIYNELIERDKLDASSYPDVYRHGAESAMKVKAYEKAKYALEYLSGTDQFTFEDGYKYIQLMLYMGKIEDARSMYAHRVVSESIDPKKNELTPYFEGSVLDDLVRDSLRYEISLAPFNSEYGDFSPAYHPKGIAFTSAKNHAMESPWAVGNTSFLSQYLFDKLTQKVKKLKGVKGKKHDGVAYYDSIDGIWYYSKNLKRHKNIPVTTVGIYTYNERTKKHEAFSYNREDQYVAHPSLSPDRQVLWFSSNRDGGFGGLDIWYSVKGENGWGEPINAGDKVNSSHDEMFPYEHNQVLYFSSNGHLGLGGLDLYTAELDGREAKQVFNAGAPLNSHGDDFSIILDSTNIQGYFSSNRGDFTDRIYQVTIKDIFIDLQAKIVSSAGDHGPIAGVRVLVKDETNQVLDTLYSDAEGKFVFKGKPERQYTLLMENPEYEDLTEVFSTVGFTKPETVDKEYTMQEKQVSFYSVIRDKETGKVVPNAKVEILDKESGKLITVYADENGKVYANLPRNRDYLITATKEGYDPTKTELNTRDSGKEIIRDIDIRKTRKGKAIHMDNILYEYNKYNLSAEGKKELDTLAMFLKENQDIRVEISSHTDCRGRDEYNMELSAHRGRSCMVYLVSRGVKKERMLVRNYGETQLKNHCDDGVACSEELHQVNRRTEFVILFPEEKGTE